MPLRTHSNTTASPTRAGNGDKRGNKEFSPASMPAQGASPHKQITTLTAVAPFPNSAESVFKYPLCFFPKYKNSKHSAKNRTEERITGNTKPTVGKKRTSSAPDRNPAPMPVPTIKKAP
ncbi:MAG: hypothetical protein K2N84_02215 [Clostridia bacterium]|nr:hypothetical protein [Clostridia bacterium]